MNRSVRRNPESILQQMEGDAPPPPPPPPPRNELAWAAWERLGAPRFVMAPMVDGSDLPFRAQCRARGTQLCFAPMVSAKAFAQYVGCKRTLAPMFDTEPGDRPLFFQLSGNEPEVCVRAALLAAPYVDGVDLNLGCPQHIAARSRYGAFLMAEPLVVEAVVRALAAVLVPRGLIVSVKIRVLPDPAATVAFARMLEAAGCMCLTVHGRTKVSGVCAGCRLLLLSFCPFCSSHGLLARDRSSAGCVWGTRTGLRLRR